MATAKCPFGNDGRDRATTNRDWWPEGLNLRILSQNSLKSSPLLADFDYAREFERLDLAAVKRDLLSLMTDSQEWWPADYGHYGPFFVRMAWHSAGTYRVGDGRGGAGAGQMRFAPLNSWPDNGNLDKARRLLWPVKRKYGQSISWADLIVLCGNVALESMGFRTFGFAGGREDAWEPEDDVDWGSEKTWLTDGARYDKNKRRELASPLGAVEMGLIYVNPQGPGGVPDPSASAKDIRETFGRMAMNDEETVALVAGGHTFGKCHGAGDPGKHVGKEPEGSSMEEQNTGWKNSLGTGNAKYTITSGLEGAWTTDPAKWDNGYFEVLFGNEWELTKSPAGAQQWRPKNWRGRRVPDAHDPSKTHEPIMLTTDLALLADPAYRKISRRFYENPAEFADAFAKAWYKLTHRDMGPHVRCLGPEVPPPQKWQDPLPAPSRDQKTRLDYLELAWIKNRLLTSGLSVSRLIATAWASASTFRASDKRGGANGARLRLEPQRRWEVNEPKELGRALGIMEKIRRDFRREFSSSVSLADVIVLGGCAALEAAAGHSLEVPFVPGRTDATQDATDVESFGVLEPRHDGFRNYLGSSSQGKLPEELLIDRAHLLGLTAPEATVLVGGLRVLGVGARDTESFTDRVGRLSNDFFVHLLDPNVEWRSVGPNSFDGRDRTSGATVRRNATRVDLVFGSHSVLRSLAEVYASDEAFFRQEFVKAFAKVMDADRFDVRARNRRTASESSRL